MEDRQRQPLKKVVKRRKVLMQEESPSRMVKDGGSMAEKLFFPSCSCQKKSKSHKGWGQRLETKPAVSRTLGRGGVSEPMDAPFAICARETSGMT